MSMDDVRLAFPGSSESLQVSQASASASCDTEKYLPLVEGFDMTEPQKQELLSCLFSIVRGFVELGFKGDICGQIFEDSDSASFASSPSVKSLQGNDKDGGST